MAHKIFLAVGLPRQPGSGFRFRWMPRFLAEIDHDATCELPPCGTLSDCRKESFLCATGISVSND